MDDKIIDEYLEKMPLEQLKLYARIGVITSLKVLQSVVNILKEKDNV